MAVVALDEGENQGSSAQASRGFSETGLGLPGAFTAPRVFSSTLGSTIESLETGVESVDSFSQEAGFDESARYFISIAVREVLANAIKHGNRFDPCKKVCLSLFENGCDLIIEIADEGEGFEVENVPDPQLPANRQRTSGRGIKMARAFMDDFSVAREPGGGSHVRMVKRLSHLETPPSAGSV